MHYKYLTYDVINCDYRVLSIYVWTFVLLVQTAGSLLYCADNKLLKQDLGDIFHKDYDVLFEDPNEEVLLTG